MQYDILVPGHYFCDLIFTGLPQFPALGTEVYTQGLSVAVGGVMNTVIALQRLGTRVGWVGQMGTDFFSAFVAQQAEREGVDLSLIQRVDRPLQRVTVAMSYPHDRAFLTYVDSAPNSIDLVLGALEQIPFRHLHFTGLQTDPRTPDLLRRVRARGVTISMDCQHRPVTLEQPIVREVLSLVDIFMPNRAEAAQLTGTSDPEQAASALLEYASTLVIKDGANGVYGWYEGQGLHLPALAVNAIDTTGAGDVFNAGYLTALLRGADFATCLRWGSISGGLSTEGLGGTQTAPDLETLEGYLF